MNRFAQIILVFGISASLHERAFALQASLLEAVLGQSKSQVEEIIGEPVADQKRLAAIPADHLLYKNGMYVRVVGGIADSVFVFSEKGDWKKALSQYAIENAKPPVELKAGGAKMLGWGPPSGNAVLVGGKAASAVYGPITGILNISLSKPTPAPAPTNPPLGAGTAIPCTAKDARYFSCKAKNGKTILVCGSKDFGAKDSWLQYQFGSEAKPELIFPGQRVDSLSKFTWNSMPTAGGDRSELSFKNEGTTYTLNLFNQGRESEATVNVEGSKSVSIACGKGFYVGAVSSFETALKCDDDSALGCKRK